MKPTFPKRRSKAWHLLEALLAGVKVDPIFFIAELNLMTGHARVSELRKAGWPVISDRRPHPKLTGEDMPVYYFDDHFRRWFRDEAKSDRRPIDPKKYPYNSGRGKFKIEQQQEEQQHD